MSRKANFLACALLITVSISLRGQSSSDISHFQSFFHSKNQQALETSLQTASQRLDQAREIGDARHEAVALKELGLLHLNRAYDYEKAMDYLIRALTIEDSLNLQPQRAFTYIAIARVFEVVGDYFKSAQFLEQALKINEEQHDVNALAMIMNNLGKVKASQGKLAEAFSHYEVVLKYRDDIDKNFEAEALFNIGHLHTHEGNYAEALTSHKKALAITRSLKDSYTEAATLNDIGILYGLMHDDDRSLANHLVALEIRETVQDKKGMAESLNNLGALRYKQKKTADAIAHGLRALELGRESQAQEQIFKSYELLSHAYKELADYKNALMYKELSLAIHEFIQNEKQERHLLETQNRYVLGKKETQIEKLEAMRLDREKEIAAQVQFRNILFVLVGLVCVIAGLLFVLYLVTRRSRLVLEVAKNEVQLQNFKLQDLNHTKDKFFSIISHDLKGPLNSLTSFSRLLIDHTENLSKEEIQMLARDLDKSLKNLFALLENLLEWSRSQTGNIDFTAEVFDLGETLRINKSLLESQARNKQINILVEEEIECHVRLHKQSINTVVRNLISNAIKFTKEGGTISLSLKTTNNLLSVSVTDNGVGMTKDILARLFRIDHKHSSQGTANEKGTGLGLILCKEFIEKNGGKIHVQSEPGKGTVFTCSFPMRVLVNTPRRVSEPASF